MNAPGASEELPPTADTIRSVYPSLAQIFAHLGEQEEETRKCNAAKAIGVLRQKGHSEPAIDEALRSVARGGPDDTLLVASEKELKEWSSIAITLSGGGLRATLFQLGILLYLALADEIKNVTGVVSVSGGSILAAHLALNWRQASGDRDGIMSVASELVKFTQNDIRNSAVIAWMWQAGPLLCFCRPSSRLVQYLRREYDQLFGNKTLEVLPASPDFPTFAFVATDPEREHRIALSRNCIWRFDFSGKLIDDKVSGEGTHISMAVAASSCFPLVFSDLAVGHEELGIRFDEFDSTLVLQDGGVTDNLGIQGMRFLSSIGAISAKRLVMCDSETGLARRGRRGRRGAVDAQGAALSAAAREAAESLGSAGILLRLRNRGAAGLKLPRRIYTSLSGYRTDLDKPSWMECYALLQHGAAVADQHLGNQITQRISPKEVKAAIQMILTEAGCPGDVPEPTDEGLKECGSRRFGLIALNFFVLLLFWIVAILVLAEPLCWIWPGRGPISYAWYRWHPERPVDRDLDSLMDQAAQAVCNKSVPQLKKKLLGSLSRITVITDGDDSVDLLKHVKTIKSSGCETQIQVEVTFRGQFDIDSSRPHTNVIVIGRIADIHENEDYVFLDVNDCSGKPAEHLP